MIETRVARVTGIGALACVALSGLQFPLWVIGEPPSCGPFCRGPDPLQPVRYTHRPAFDLAQ